MRGNLRYTPTHAVQQEPMKSAREGNCFRLASDGVVPSSRTITRTISTFAFFANQRNHGYDGQNADRNTVSPQFRRAANSDCIPDVLLQVIGLMQVISDCPLTVRVLEGVARAD
jgi:hypothetical protein